MLPMPVSKNPFLQQFMRVAFALLATLCLMRVFEYIVVASKSFTAHAYKYELAGLLYDVWLWFIYCGIAFAICWLVSKISIKAGIVLFHVLNVLFIISCLALLITFSQRNNPFDHELFTRNAKDTVETIKQMMSAGIKPYISFSFTSLVIF
jgi:hypothetical protein